MDSYLMSKTHEQNSAFSHAEIPLPIQVQLETLHVIPHW